MPDISLIPESAWNAIRQRAANPAFAAAMQRLEQNVAYLMRQPVDVPPEPAGYYHDYFCPDHGVQLIFNPATPTEHRCPVDHGAYHGQRFDTAWRWFVNNLLSESAIQLAVLWRLQNRADYLQRVTEILQDYAGQYATYATFPNPGQNPGVATYTTLDESVWVIPLAWAFDMIREQLAPETAEMIGSQLLAPAAEHLVNHHFRGIHNFSCWHNAAIGTIGLVLGREDLFDFALHSEYGVEAQLWQGVLPDGLWFEGSFSYHFYALSGLLDLAKATLHRPGQTLHKHPVLHNMLSAPIRCAFPDGSLPATNDCWYFTSLIGDVCHGVPPGAAFYEVGYALYQDPAYAMVLNRAYRHGPRDSLNALLFGPEVIPPEMEKPLPSVLMPDSGYAILRDTPQSAQASTTGAFDSRGLAEGQRYILLKYGPHGGGHGHPDKLDLFLYDFSQRYSVDLGTPGYGLDLFQSWYRQTSSHNTVIVDGASQPPAHGHLRAFQDNGSFQVADAGLSWNEDAESPPGPYAGLKMRRVILARPAYFLDIFRVDNGREVHQLDWFYHNAGALEVAGAFTPRPAHAAGAGYEHIAHLSDMATGEPVTASWRWNQAGLQLFMCGDPGTEILTGAVPGSPPTDPLGLLINRRQAANTTFLSLFHSYAIEPQITSVRWFGQDLAQTDWMACLVQLPDSYECWTIRTSAATEIPAQVQEQISAATGSQAYAQFDYVIDL